MQHESAQPATTAMDPTAARGRGSATLMDATPRRIKRRNMGAKQRHVEVHEPETTEELQQFVREQHANAQPYTVVGAQSNVVGAIDTDVGTVLSTRRLAGVWSFDPVSQVVTVGAGTMGGELESWLNERGFTLGQFPQSLHISTVGGWFNTRASGALSARNGGVEHAIKGATILLADGELLEFAPRVRTGGGLDALHALVGTEGSLGVVAEVTLEVRRNLPERSACFLFGGLRAIIDAQREIVQGGYPVALLRGYNSAETDHVLGSDSAGRCLLMVSTIGPESMVDAQLSAIRERLVALGGTILPRDAADRWYRERFDVETMMEGRNAEAGRAFDTIEVSTTWSRAAECAEQMERELSAAASPFYLHFSHAYETGVCFYSLLWIEADTDSEALERLDSAWETVLDVVTAHGGQIGHHHGIGAARASRYALSADAFVHRAVKDSLDPGGLLRTRLLDAPLDADR